MLPSQIPAGTLFDFLGALSGDFPRAVLKAAERGLGNPQFFGEVLARKVFFLPVGAQNGVGSRHNDTHRIARYGGNAIPFVSDAASICIYDAEMGKSSRKSKAPDWSAALDDHVKASKTVTWAKIAATMDMTEGGIRHWRNGTRAIKLDEFISLCKAAGADPWTVMRGEVRTSSSEEDLPAREQMLLLIFRGLTPQQQRETVLKLQAQHEANRYIQRHLEKPLRTFSNEEVEAAFGSVPVPRSDKRRRKPKRQLGDAMGDFLDE